MNDAFIKFVWQYGRFDKKNLCTQTGEPIEIISAGTPNPKSGPDFTGATLRIGKDLWKGGIVVQVDGGDWYSRQHDFNANYSNVILSVSFRNVLPASNIGGRQIPTLELNGKIPAEFIDFYNDLMKSRSVLSCQESFNGFDKLTLIALRDRLITERLEIRSGEIFRILDDVEWDWDMAFYKLLIRYYGDGIATVNFKELSRMLNYEVLLENKQSIFSCEAMIFGQAGLLDGEFKDSYPKILQDQFNDLRMVYDLEVMDPEAWNNSTPAAGPKVAQILAQLAWMINNEELAFQHFLEAAEPARMVRHVRHSFYWDDHIGFDQPVNGERPAPVNDPSQRLMINVITPAIYAYGKAMGVPDICLHTLDILHEMEPEVNRKTALLSSINLPIRSAADSQAGGHLMNSYCINKLCLSCPVGRLIMNGNRDEICDPESSMFEHLYN